jgi:hypothetical protein
VTQATHRNILADVNFVVLKGTNENCMVPVAGHVGERERFMSVVSVQTNEATWVAIDKKLFKRPLQIDTRGDWKCPASGDDLFEFQRREVLPQQLAREAIGSTKGPKHLI